MAGKSEKYDIACDYLDWDEKNQKLVFQVNETFSPVEKKIFGYIEKSTVFLSSKFKISAQQIFQLTIEEDTPVTIRKKILMSQSLLFSSIDSLFPHYAYLFALVFCAPIGHLRSLKSRHQKLSTAGSDPSYQLTYDELIECLKRSPTLKDDQEESFVSNAGQSLILANPKLIIFRQYSTERSARILFRVIRSLCSIDLRTRKIGSAPESTRSRINTGRRIFIILMNMIYPVVTDREIATFLSEPSFVDSAIFRLSAHRRTHIDLMSDPNSDYVEYCKDFQKVLNHLIRVAELHEECQRLKL